jgi:predicted DNA-binding ribbon-helix-helix protein
VKRKHPAGPPRKTSTNVKRSIFTAGRKTSATLEDAFWNALYEIAACKNTSRPELVVMIDKKRSHPNLSSAIRLFVLDHYRGMAKRKRTEE